MSQQELLKRVVAVLDSAAVPYMLTGSTVSSLQGEPRASHDIDFVVECSEAAVPELTAAFPAPEFYFSDDAARDAIRRLSMFNLLHVDTGDKVDFWLLTPEPFDRSRFSRRISEEMFGASLWVSAPEDTILAKLRWCQMAGGSEKQFNDALRVYEVQMPQLNLEYLSRWVGELDINAEWQRLRDTADVD